MSLIIEAYSPPEGIALVRDAQQSLRLVRPPYLNRQSPILAETAVREAVEKHDFFACGQTFADWQAVIDFLNGEVATARAQAGLALPEETPAQALLELAPPEIIEGFLQRVAAELIPQRQFEHAENFLIALLQAQPEKYGKRAADLLNDCREARNRLTASEANWQQSAPWFPSLEQRGQTGLCRKIGETLMKKHSFFGADASVTHA